MSARNDDNVIEKNPSEKLQRDCLTKHPERADLMDISEPGSSLSHKTDKSRTEPDSSYKKRAQKPSSLTNLEEGHSKGANSRDTAVPNSSHSVKAEKPKSVPDSVPKKRGQKKNSLEKSEGGGHPRRGRAESRVTAEPNISLSIKADTTKGDPDTVPEKRGQKSSSSMDSQEDLLKRANSRGIVVPNSLASIKAEKSESEADSVPRKRGRKPNSLMNPEEGYDNSWVSSEKKAFGPSRCRNSRGKTVDNSPSRNSISKKGTYSSTLDNVTESAVSQRPRPKRKGSTLNHEDDTKSPSAIKVEEVRSQVEEKSPKCIDLNMKIKPEDSRLIEEKEQGNSEKLGLVSKENEVTAVASGQVVAHKEIEVPGHPEEKLQQLPTVMSEAANVNDHSSPTRATRKRKGVSNSSNTGTNKESGLKVRPEIF